MGLLADVFSYGDGLKRKMRGLLDDPAGTVDLGARRFNEDQGGLLNLFANAYPMGGDKTVLNTPEQRKQMQAEAASKALEVYGGLLGATVWHGSPHKFDKFDSSKIGTGEGAQAYGHGIYTAESKQVADQYRVNLSYDPAQMKIGGRQINDYYTRIQDGAARMPVKAAAGEYEKLELLERLMSNDSVDDVAQAAAAMSPSTKAWFEKQVKPQFQSYGHLYKVDLPDDAIAKMLDWDKPLSQQAPMTQQRIYDSMLDAGFDKAITNHILNNKTGRELMNELGGRLAVRNPSPMSGSAQASDFVKKAGIPGIRYLDGGSRGAGGGTSNYVVFPGNEGLLQILERNGSPIP